MAGLLGHLLQAGTVLTAVHRVVVTPEALLEAGVQGALREEVSGEAEEAAGNLKKLSSEKDPNGSFFLISTLFESISDRSFRSILNLILLNFCLRGS